MQFMRTEEDLLSAMRYLTEDEIQDIVSVLSATSTNVRQLADGTIEYTSLKVPGATQEARELLVSELQSEYTKRLRDVRVHPNTITTLKHKFLDYVRTSFVQAGDNVGGDAAMALFVFIMQMTLDSHKSSGAFKQTSSDMKRIEQILNVTPNVTGKQMSIHFKNKSLSLGDVLTYRQYIEDSRISSLSIDYYEGFTDEWRSDILSNPVSTAYMQRHQHTSQLIDSSLYLYVVELESYKMYTHGLTASMLATRTNILTGMEDENEPDTFAIPYTDISSSSGLRVDYMLIVLNMASFGDDRASDGEGSLEHINANIRPKLVEGTTVKGVKGVNRVEPRAFPLVAFIQEERTGSYTVNAYTYNRAILLNVDQCKQFGIDATRIKSLFDLCGIPSTLDINNGPLSNYILYASYTTQSKELLSYLSSIIELADPEQDELPWDNALVLENTTNGVHVTSSNRDLIKSNIIELQLHSTLPIVANANGYTVANTTKTDLTRVMIERTKSLLTYNYLISYGSNMVGLAKLQFIDSNTLSTNNYYEVYHSHGIVGFNKNILGEMNRLIGNIGSINKQHTELFVDRMCYRGLPLAVNEKGLEIAGASYIMLASKAKATDYFAKAAAYGTTGRTNRIMSSVMFADVPRVGTGMPEVHIDKQMLAKKYGKEDARRLTEYLTTNQVRKVERSYIEQEESGPRFSLQRRKVRQPTTRSGRFKKILAASRSKEAEVSKSHTMRSVRASTTSAPQTLTNSTYATGTYTLAGTSLLAPNTDSQDAMSYVTRISKRLWNTEDILPISDTIGSSDILHTNPEVPTGISYSPELPASITDALSKQDTRLFTQNIYDYKIYSIKNPVLTIRNRKLGSFNTSKKPLKLNTHMSIPNVQTYSELL